MLQQQETVTTVLTTSSNTCNEASSNGSNGHGNTRNHNQNARILIAFGGLSVSDAQHTARQVAWDVTYRPYSETETNAKPSQNVSCKASRSYALKSTCPVS